MYSYIVICTYAYIYTHKLTYHSHISSSTSFMNIYHSPVAGTVAVEAVLAEPGGRAQKRLNRILGRGVDWIIGLV